MARPSFRRACCIRTSDTRSAKTVPDKQPVCHNSKAASACPLNANERKVGTMSARRAARLGRRALQETGARLPHSGRMGSKRNHRRDELRIIPDVLFRSLAPMTEHNPGLTKREQDVYTSTMREGALKKQLAVELFDLPCACQNLRRVTRIVTRIYDQELRKAGLEITQFGLLTALATTGEANQKRLSAGFAMDSTTLTRTLGLLRRQGWVRVRRGKDRRERLFRLTQAGKRQMAEAEPYWGRAEQRLRRELGDTGWKSMKQMVSRITVAATAA